jgi:hypothetical protein
MTTPSVQPAALQQAALQIWIEATVEQLTLAKPFYPMPRVCDEGQNALRSAVSSVNNALLTASVMNRVEKRSKGKAVQGQYTAAAQDALRAALLFAGAGLDQALKRLVADTLPVLVEHDNQVDEKFQKFAEIAISHEEGVSPRKLVGLLMGRGDTPREILVNQWVRTLTDGSAQSADRVSELSSVLGVTKGDLRKRVAPTPARSSKLELAFAARNQISHELDLTKPAAEARVRLERIRRIRKVEELSQHAKECLQVTQLIINDVAVRIPS